MSRKGRITNALFALILTFSLLAASTGTTLAKKNDPPKADPRLLQMAEENPNDTFMVIVQKKAKNKNLKGDDPEIAVKKGGGNVKEKFDMIVSFSAELKGKEITRLAKNPKVHWISADAPMISISPSEGSTTRPGMDTLRDEFTSVSYGGNNGDMGWSMNWEEVGESTDPENGRILLDDGNSCQQDYCLRFKPASPEGQYIYRQADLNGYVSVWLSFYRNNSFKTTNKNITDEVQLQVSPDGGASWTTLQSYSNKNNIGAATDSFDIRAYAGPNTQIRFIITAGKNGAGSLFIDDIEIAFARPSAYRSAVKTDQLSLDGQGVTVAVVDSGITTKNADFYSGRQSRIITSAYFGNQDSTKDLYGHGTHVAGILGGNGGASGGIYRGVAPGVNLINLRVSDKDGMTYESSLVRSLQWIYNNKDLYNIRVVNISMNSTVAQSYHTSPLAAAVETLWFNDIVVVVSAGNNGTGGGPATVYPPANDPFVITVGATEDKGTSTLADDNLADFSAYNLTEDGFSKPDLVAPGRNLIGPLSEKASTVYNAHPYHRVGDDYFRMSGTSMSAPVVSGAVALLLQDEPGLTPDQVKYRLMTTADKNWSGYNPTTAGAGYLDINAAVYANTTDSANQGIIVSQMLSTGDDPVAWGSVGWNSVGWNSVGWNSVGWNSVGWNSVGWNSNTWDD